MLVLTRKQNEKIRIGDSITITVLRMKGKAVRLGIEAPQELNVIRGELCFDLEDGSITSHNDSQEEAPASVPPKSKPRDSGSRRAIAEEATSHWPTGAQNQAETQPAQCALPLDSSPLRAMIEARGV